MIRTPTRASVILTSENTMSRSVSAHEQESGPHNVIDRSFKNHSSELVTPYIGIVLFVAGSDLDRFLKEMTSVTGQ